MFQHILLAVALQHSDTPSPHALAARDAAIALVNGSGARLSVLTVYSYSDFVAPDLPLEELGRYRQSQIQRIDEEMEAKLKALFRCLAWPDLPIIPLLEVGKPGPVIIRTAERLGVDLIVIGTHSKRSFLDVLLGGTAAYVSRHARCPVILAQPPHPQWFLGG